MKRLLLGILTLISLVPLVLSLVGSFTQPQVQSQLQLLQTDLFLAASEWQPGAELDGASSLQAIIQQSQPKQNARQQYQQAADELESYIERLQNRQVLGSSGLSNLEQDNLETTEIILDETLSKIITENQNNLEQIQLKLRFLTNDSPINSLLSADLQPFLTSSDASTKTVATLLESLKENTIPDNAASEFQDNLKGWFQWQALELLYRRHANLPPTAVCETPDCQALHTTIQTQAQQSVIKLGVMNGIPLLLGGAGLILAITLLVQWGINPDNAILKTNADVQWQTPWDWEMIWQVLVVGFFFSSQILLPGGLVLLGLPVATFTILEKAIYVFATYAVIAAWGVGTLIVSLWSFRPLPEDWFTLRLNGKSLLWGVGGYLVALPLVVLISLLNQAFWQGQGGSNPLLSLALNSQNSWVLFLFFLTAAVFAPLFEEVLFRGFLLPSLTRYFSVSTAIVISSLVFAIAHLSLAEILPLFVLGMVLGVTYSRSRNLVASMLLHGLWNSGTLLSLYLLGS